jgi:hypothetical protein
MRLNRPRSKPIGRHWQPKRTQLKMILKTSAMEWSRGLRKSSMVKNEH